MIRPFAAALVAATLLSAPAAAKAPKIDGVWVRLPAVAGRPAAGFLAIHGGAKADQLVAVQSPAAERIEMHSMTHENGVMRMRAESSVAVPAGGHIRFAPGGHHLMLFGLKPDLKPGQSVPITFTFQSGAKLVVDAGTRAAADPAPEAGGGHQHH